MLEESKRMSEHIIEITELKLRRVGGGRDGKGRENAGKMQRPVLGKTSYITELLLGSQPEYLCRSFHLSL